jgi:hypothetical protein
MTSTEGSLHDLPSIKALGLEFARVASEESQRRPQFQSVSTRRWVPALAALGIAATLTAASFTPPGRAVADQVGEFVGLVDDHHVVIGLGQTNYEHHPYHVYVMGEPQPGETCVFFEFKEVAGSNMGSCLNGIGLSDLANDKLAPFVYWPPDGLLPKGSAVVQGLATPDVARVEISFRNAEGNKVQVPVDTSDLTVEMLQKIGLSDGPARFFVAFLPPEAMRDATFATHVPELQKDAHLPGVEIRAFDSQGNEIGSRSLANLDPQETRLGWSLFGPPPTDGAVPGGTQHHG